jgi:phosphoserine phosphatase
MSCASVLSQWRLSQCFDTYFEIGKACFTLGLHNLYILHISGPDRPGITSKLMTKLAEEGLEVLDLGQSVVKGHLTLSLVLKTRSTKATLALQKKLKVFRGFDCQIQPVRESTRRTRVTPWVVTLLGKLGSGQAIAAVTQVLAQQGVNISGIRTLTRDELVGVELKIEIPISIKAFQLKAQLMRLAQTHRLDMALQEDNLQRLNRRLICLDVDSTVVDMEVIDELARLHSREAFDEVQEITRLAMEGHINFDSALKRRVACLKGLPLRRAMSLTEQIPYNPGIKRLIKQCKSLGIVVGVLSGGFDFFVSQVRRDLNLDFAFSNQLVVFQGKLTGQLEGPIVNAKKKSQLLGRMSREFGVPLNQCIAIGDGANDRQMLEKAGLGVAYRAKPKLLAVADSNWDQSHFDSLLFLMGLEARLFDS